MNDIIGDENWILFFKKKKISKNHTIRFKNLIFDRLPIGHPSDTSSIRPKGQVAAGRRHRISFAFVSRPFGPGPVRRIYLSSSIYMGVSRTNSRFVDPFYTHTLAHAHTHTHTLLLFRSSTSVSCLRENIYQQANRFHTHNYIYYMYIYKCYTIRIRIRK